MTESSAGNAETSWLCSWSGCRKRDVLDGHCLKHACMVCIPLDGQCDECPADGGAKPEKGDE